MHLFFNQNDKLHILIRILHKYWTCFALSENVKVNTILFIWDMIWRKISMFWKGGGGTRTQFCISCHSFPVLFVQRYTKDS